MKNYSLTLQVLKEMYCVCKGLPSDLINDIMNKSNFFSFTKTSDELSVVCNQEVIPDYIGAVYEKDWKILKVIGPLDFALVGILSNLSYYLTQAGISIFVISTYDTDYVLVKDSDLKEAIHALEAGGHIINSL